MKRSEANPILQNLLSDIGGQPPWRGRAAVCMAWRDNIQWTKEQKAYFKTLGLPDNMFVNLMASAMDAVTGYEAKHRVDWMITAADERHDDMAEALNQELNDAMRLSDANHACSEAYESQAGVGIGWVHVTRNPDPLAASSLLIEDVHRDEMFWDMLARSEDLRRDCRWVARRKFFDKDEAKVFLGKKHHELIDFTFSDYQTIDIGEGSQAADWLSEMIEYTDPIELIMDNNSARKRVAIYEVHYKVFEKRDLLIVQNGSVMVFNPGNNIHLEMLATGNGYVQKKIPINVVRVAWFLGPYLIYDGPSNAPHNQFPYIPFFGPREDATNAPTGLLERMMGPQEQYNRAVLEIQRILRSRRVEKDIDAVPDMSDQQVVFEINRTDGVINLKPNRKFAVIREWDKLQALEGICNRSRDEINAASGIYQTFQGQTEAKQSGIAVESIAELGAQTLGKINANYQLSRKFVGDLVFSYLVEDIGVQRRVVNVKQGIGQQKKQVVLNDGPNNMIQMMRAQVALQEVHTSAGYKQHTHQRLSGIMEQMPDDFKTILLPFWLESSELPNKEQAIKLVNKKLGYEEDEQRRQLLEEQQAQDEKQQRELELRAFVAEVEEKEASTREKDAAAKDRSAQASNHMAEAIKKRVETAKLLREFKQMGMTGPDRNTTGRSTPRLISNTQPSDQREGVPPGA
ncbi:MAG: hypothetical protein DRH10_00910 [Deltaproteobacteria bacterium]|nr:MAG: hypothetical protein DRH10_00910 [Deltaproteobacteria bacterium]RLC88374.1 MAG: hypothetical protein DRJ03_02975 [Chloroflexota bacterium]